MQKQLLGSFFPKHRPETRGEVRRKELMST